MSNKLFVGNLSWNTTDDSLKAFFSKAGNVVTASVIRDKMTGRSRGYAFVEFSTEEEANNAKNTLNGQDLDGRQIRIDEARPRDNNN